MVVIEHMPSAREEKNTVDAIVADSESKSEAPHVSSSDTSERGAEESRRQKAVSGYASDGYETASDTELNNDTDDSADKGDEAAVNSSTATAEGNIDNNSSNHGESQELRRSHQQLSEDPSNVQSSSGEASLEMAFSQANDAKLEGNKFFKDGLFEEALSKYELALHVMQESPSFDEIRSICHANRAACFFKMEKYEDTIKECTSALKINSSYMKALIRRGEAHEKLEQFDEAIADMTKVLELDPSHDQARRTVVRLKPLADEKREKMKEEMIGKLKDMGNSILGRFGMSVDNFKAVKDPNTGSYSISFQK